LAVQVIATKSAQDAQLQACMSGPTPAPSQRPGGTPLVESQEAEQCQTPPTVPEVQNPTPNVMETPEKVAEAPMEASRAPIAGRKPPTSPEVKNPNQNLMETSGKGSEVPAATNNKADVAGPTPSTLLETLGKGVDARLAADKADIAGTSALVQAGPIMIFPRAPSESYATTVDQDFLDDDSEAWFTAGTAQVVQCAFATMQKPKPPQTQTQMVSLNKAGVADTSAKTGQPLDAVDSSASTIAGTVLMRQRSSSLAMSAESLAATEDQDFLEDDNDMMQMWVAKTMAQQLQDWS